MKVIVELCYLTDGTWKRERRELEQNAIGKVAVSTPHGAVLDMISLTEQWPGRPGSYTMRACGPALVLPQSRSIHEYVTFTDPELLQRTSDYWTQFASAAPKEADEHFCTVVTLAEHVLALHGGSTPENVEDLSKELVRCVEGWLERRETKERTAT